MYTFHLPNTKIRFYQVFAYGIVLLNTLAMAMVQSHNKNIVIQTAVLVTIFILMALWDGRNYRKGRRMLPLGLLMIGYSFFWLRFGANWAFLANMVLWGLYSIAKRKMTITVSEENVVYPSFPKRRLQWSELNNVILKDGILTIDCKSNKVYQHLIQNSEQMVNEAEFNDFCGRQLIK